jgi:hypothetical protein
MSALIMVDLDQLHPVFDDRWHRVRLRRMPNPGELITTLCGRTEEVIYGTSADQVVTIRTCWSCDLVHRRDNDIAVLPTHPGLAASSAPTQRIE